MIWIYDSDKMTIGKQIEGSGNPNADGYGELYYAQIGTMVRATTLSLPSINNMVY